jgi:hypothetical protein
MKTMAGPLRKEEQHDRKSLGPRSLHGIDPPVEQATRYPGV